MELRIRLFAALLLDIWAYDFFIAMTTDGVDKGTFRPKFTAPPWLFDRRNSLKHFAGSQTFDGLHHLRWTGGGNRLQKEVAMLFIRANLQANNGIPFGDVSTDLFEHRIDTGVKPNAAILCRTDQMGHPYRNIGALMDICAHTSDNNCFKTCARVLNPN